jgi:hypothetical protein
MMAATARGTPTDDRTTNCTNRTNRPVRFVAFVRFVVRAGGDA